MLFCLIWMYAILIYSLTEARVCVKKSQLAQKRYVKMLKVLLSLILWLLLLLLFYYYCHYYYYYYYYHYYFIIIIMILSFVFTVLLLVLYLCNCYILIIWLWIGEKSSDGFCRGQTIESHFISVSTCWRCFKWLLAASQLNAMLA